MILIAYGELQRSREEYRSNIKIEHIVEVLKERLSEEIHCYGDSHRTLLKNIKTIEVIM